MRLVFVNHAHPDVPHVSGMRTGYFAREMVKLGHQVVLLTSTVPGSAFVDLTSRDVAKSLARQDWRRPLVVAVSPVYRRALEVIRHGTLPGVLRRAMTLWQFIAHGGVFADWHRAASDAIEQLAVEFKPDLVWGTFGNTTNLAIAQQLALGANCPWVMDIKDSWTAFIPRALRRHLARGFRDAAGWTSNSRHHQEIASRWFPSMRTEVIYSGVAEEFFVDPGVSPEHCARQLLLVGSVYDERRLTSYLSVVREWMDSLPHAERALVCFAYAGADSERVMAALESVPLPCEVRVMQYRSIADLATLARASFANSYLTASFTFHHKLLELLVCGRPLICFPSEREESKALASQVTTMFVSCDSEAAVRDALATAWARRDVATVRNTNPPWRWADFALKLEENFRQRILERQH